MCSPELCGTLSQEAAFTLQIAKPSILRESFAPLPHTQIMRHHAPSPEPLEARIAPAVFTFTDVDGDLVTLSTSKGTDSDLASVVQPHLLASGVGFQLQEIGLKDDAIFQGTNLVVASTATGGGDGLVNVGYIDATGLDLGSVTVDGDLGQIDAGDANAKTIALRSLSAVSMGVQGTATQAAGGSLVSTVIGAVGAFTLSGDFHQATLLVVGAAVDPLPLVHDAADTVAKIAVIDIAGSIIGGVAAKSGSIETKGAIGKVTVGGSITGSGGDESGRIFTEDRMGAVNVLGSVIGGGARDSGQIFSAGRMGSVEIGTAFVPGHLIGGGGARSGLISSAANMGSVTVHGDVRGGSADDSGAIGSSGTIGRIIIDGDVQGGDGTRSGSIQCSAAMLAVTIHGDLRGGLGDQSGLIASVQTIASLTVDGSIVGGDGIQSGAVGSFKPLGAVLVKGDVVGGEGDSSGQIVSATKITRVTILGSLVGGGGYESGAIGSVQALGPISIGQHLIAGEGDRSGLIVSQNGSEDATALPGTIASVTIGGNIHGIPVTTAGVELDQDPGLNAGAILSDGAVGAVIVTGTVIGGNNDNTGTIAAHTIRSVAIGRLLGGSGDSSGAVLTTGALGPVTVAGDLEGGGGTFSGSITSVGKMGKVTIGSLLGGGGDFSGLIETQDSGADMGAVKITRSITGGDGLGSGAIFSSGKLGTVTAGDLIGGAGTGSGSIGSAGDMGAVRILGNVEGGDADESGKISSGGRIASLTIDGDLLGGSGNYTTTVDTTAEIGQIFADGAIGPVKIGGSMIGSDNRDGSGAQSAVIRGAAIRSLTLGGNMDGAGLTSTSLDIGPVGIGSLMMGSFIASSRDLLSLEAFGFLGNPGAKNRISATDTIGAVTVSHDAFFTTIVAGMEPGGAFTNAYAQIGRVLIGTVGSGNARALDIVAGATPGRDLRFGTSDDAAISSSIKGPLSKIASVIIKGAIQKTSATTDHFGIVAQHVAAVKVGGSSILLKSGPRNDGLIDLSSDSVAQMSVYELLPLG